MSRHITTGAGALIAAVVVGGSLSGTAHGSQLVTLAPSAGTCSQLSGVAALTAGDVWAVGSSCSRSVDRTLALHWNGRVWSVVQAPNVGAYGSSLRKVVALSPTDVWAVGSYKKDSRGTMRTLAVHWNGTSWRVVATPNATGPSTLEDIAAVSPTNVWAVGTGSRAGADNPLIVHWNGTAWRTVTAPTGRSYALRAVSAVSARDIWAVGDRMSTVGTVATLTMHWNGTAWGVIPAPNAGVRKNNFLAGGVRAVAGNDVWAVGSYNAGSETAPVFRTLTLHWTGSRWTVVTGPLRSSSHLYGGVSSTAGNDVWAVGATGRFALVEHWSGRSWTVLPTPNPGTRENTLLGVAAVSRTLAFAVGYRSSAVGTTQTLVLRWNGRAWQAM